jgi:formylglycine-generating enzyme required for sulfatase activity
MQRLPKRRFAMGSDRFYPEEAPVRAVEVDAFWIDEVPVTNAAFARFVDATGYVTAAEVPPDVTGFPGLDDGSLDAGSLVFERTAVPVATDDPALWWHYVSGADWRHPFGPQSDIEGMDDHPVVHVAFADALAYATWAGKALPTEAEWEYAARGGLDGVEFAWGDELAPGGAMMANYWQGLFPFANQLLDGYERTSPVRAFPANGFGLHDMIGNVWEWTADWYAPAGRTRRKAKGCCDIPVNPRGGRERDSVDRHGDCQIGRKVLKGGSHLCAANYCQRYRPAARQAQTIDTSTGHIGFRCVVRG